MKTETVQNFLQDVTRWASDQRNMVALALIGSYARGTATEESDVDLILLASEPCAYLDDPQWMDEFGSVLRQQEESYGAVTSIRVWYQSGMEVEFGIAGKEWAEIPLDPGTQQVIAGGMQVLFEREMILSQHLER